MPTAALEESDVSDISLVRKLDVAEERRRIAEGDANYRSQQERRWLIDRVLSWLFLRLLFGRVPKQSPYGDVFDRWIPENAHPNDELWECSRDCGIDRFIGYAIIREGKPTATLFHTQALVEFKGAAS